MQSLRTLTLTLLGYLVTSGIVVAYFAGIGGPPTLLVSHLVTLLFSMGSLLCAWLCFAASTARPSPAAYAMGCGFAAGTASYAISLAFRQLPVGAPVGMPFLWAWSLPAGLAVIISLLMQRSTRLRARRELSIGIFASFAFGCVVAYGIRQAPAMDPVVPYLAGVAAAVLAALLMIPHARKDSFQVSWAGAIVLLSLAGLTSAEVFQSRFSSGVLALMGVWVFGAIPIGFCFDGVRAVRAQAAQAGELDPAIRDALTGLYNRRALDNMGKEMYRQALRADRPVSILMLDIDHFKQVNDLNGHAAGDHILTRFAAIISEHLRTSDFVARYGGEEFVAILPGAPLAPAIRLAERIRQAIEAAEFLHAGKKIRVTTSIGAATDFPGENRDFRQLLERADKNLYRAKRNGRNQIITDPLQEDTA